MEIVNSAIHVGKRMFKGKRILIIGAHPDDIELGMGATLNQIKGEDVKIIVFSDTVERNGTDIIFELSKSMAIYGLSYTLIKDVDNMKFTDKSIQIRQKLYNTKKEFKPDIIFSPNRTSYNPDHRVLGESCLAVFQEQTILFYEVIRGDYEHIPNMYNTVSIDDMLVKQQALMQYKTQQKATYTSSNITQSKAIFRGAQCGAEFAETFEVGRIIL